MEKVECGLLKDISDFLKTVSDIVFKAFDKLNQLGIETKDVKKNSDGSITGKLVSSNDKSKYIEWKMKPKEGSNAYDLWCTPSKAYGAKATNCSFKDVTEKELYEKLVTAIDELYEESPGDWVEASSKLKVSLKRIVGDDESSVELCGIKTSLPIKSATEILNNLMIDEFVEAIPETETWYSVTDVGEEYDVNECEACECDVPYSLMQCLIQAFQCLSTFQAVHWNAVGKDFFTLHEKLDEYIEQIQSNIDELAEMYKQTHNIIPAPATFYKDDNVVAINVDEGFDIVYGFNAVKAVLDVYTMTLSCYYCNLPSDMQSKFDEYLSYWNKEVQYKLDSLLSYGN